MALSEANFHCHYEFLPNEMRRDMFEKDRRSCLKPFGLGGRNCLGKSLALAEMRLVLARLIWHFELSAASRKQHSGKISRPT
jgi:cytochrome P450